MELNLHIIIQADRQENLHHSMPIAGSAMLKRSTPSRTLTPKGQAWVQTVHRVIHLEYIY